MIGWWVIRVFVLSEVTLCTSVMNAHLLNWDYAPLEIALLISERWAWLTVKVYTTPLFMKCNTFFHACLLLTKLMYRFTWRKNLMPWAFTIKWNKNNVNVLYNETMNRAPYSYTSWRQRVDLVVNFGTKNATLSVTTNRLPNKRIKPWFFFSYNLSSVLRMTDIPTTKHNEYILRLGGIFTGRLSVSR